MTSGLASDSDKFKILITLRRRKNLETRDHIKISIFLIFYAMFSFAMTSGLARDSDKFKILINAAPGAKNLETRDHIKISIFLIFYAMFSFAMTSGLARDSDKFKIIITLRRAQKFGDTGPYKNFDFLDFLCHVQFCHDKRLGKGF